MKGQGVGKVSVRVALDSDKVDYINLLDVLYVEELAINLLSVSAATRKGMSVEFPKDTCRMSLPEGKVVCRGVKEGNLWKLSLRTPAHLAGVAPDGPTLADLWHQRLGHINDQTLTKAIKDNIIVGSRINPNYVVSFCEGCTLGKMVAQRHYSVGEVRAMRRLQRVHSDVCGPITPTSGGGKRYFITFTDEYSRATAVYLMAQKSEALDRFKEFEADVVGETGKRIGLPVLRTDNGTEYVNQEFRKYLVSRQITHEMSVLYTPQQNGIAERVNRTLLEKARAMLAHADLPKNYWAEAIKTAAYLKNRTPTRSLDGRTPYEVWYQRACDVSHLRVWRCIAYARLPNQREKFGSRAVKLSFIGYEKGNKGYRLCDDISGKIHVARDVIFNETEFRGPEETVVELEEVTCKLPAGQPLAPVPQNAERDGAEANLPEKQASELKNEQDPKDDQRSVRPRRQRKEPDWYGDTVAHYALFAGGFSEPTTMSEALKTPEEESWKAAAEDELKSLKGNCAWELVPLPPDRKTVGSRWVFKVKRKEDGNIDHFKCRLVAKGYSQRPDIAQAVSAVAKYTAAPSEAHMTAAMRILRHLKGSADLGLMYHRDGQQLTAYCDADWAGDRDDRKSTSGNLLLLADGAVSWLSKKQASVALSTTEAEYNALSQCTQEIIWLRCLLLEIGDELPTPTVVQEDNQGTINLAKNPGSSRRTKHDVDIRFHFTREAMEDGAISLQYCPTKDMIADLLMKPIPWKQFERLRTGLGMVVRSG